MRDEFKTETQREWDRYNWRTIMYIFSISQIITCNVFFGIFVWNPYDTAPNFALGITSLLIILLILYNWKRDKELIKAKFIN